MVPETEQTPVVVQEPGSPAATPDFAPPGYEVLEEVGRGGMGVVYKARQLALNRVVALKRVRPEQVGDTTQVRRSRQEAELAARLRHPNVVQIHEVGEHLGCPFQALEFIDGPNLAHRIQGQPQPPEEAARLILALAEAMQHAHEQGVVHRDLKPGNVLLTGAGVPKIVDFGLARRVNLDDRLTQTGQILGTPSYMPPEQALGRTDVGPPADIYALGAILYECLTGQPPFRGVHVLETLEQIVSQEPVPPVRLRPRLPRDLNIITLKCLEKSPGRRYATAGALADDLRRFLEGRPIQARAVGSVERLWRLARRNPALASVLTLLALSLVVVAAISLAFAWHAGTAARELRHALTDANTQRQRAQQGERTASLRLAQQYLERGQEFGDKGERGRALLWLARGLQAMPENEDDLDWVLRANLDAWGRNLIPLRAVLPHGGRLTSVGFSPSGRRALTCSSAGAAQLWEVPSFRPVGAAMRCALPIQLDGSSALDLLGLFSFSGDGRRLLLGTEDGSARLHDGETGQPLGPAFRHPGGRLKIALDRTGERALTGNQDGMVRFWQPATGLPIGEPYRHKGEILTLAFHPSKPLALTAATGSGPVALDISTGKRTTTEWQPSLPIRKVVFSPDGRFAAVASADGTLVLRDLVAGQTLPGFTTRLPNPGDLAFRSDGQVLAASSRADGTIQAWEVPSGQPLGKPFYQRDATEQIVFVPGSRLLVCAGDSGTGHLWEVNADGARAIGQPLMHRSRVWGVACSPDGRFVLTGSVDRTARAWDVLAAWPREPTLWQLRHLTALAFHPTRCAVLTGDASEPRLYDGITGQALGPVLPHPLPVLAVAFASDGKTAWTVDADLIARRWDPGTGQPVGLARSCREGESQLRSVRISPRGQKLFIQEASRPPRVHELEQGRGFSLREEGSPPTLRTGRPWFSPDGMAVVLSSGNVARLWDLATGQPRSAPIVHKGLIISVGYTTDSRYLFTLGDQVVQMWDVRTGKPHAAPLKHDTWVSAAAFHPEGKVIATGDFRGVTQFWDVETGRLLGRPLEQEGLVHDLAFPAAGRLVLTLDNRASRLWRYPEREAVGRAMLYPGATFGAFANRGKVVLLGRREHNARFWHAPTGYGLGPPLPCALMSRVRFNPTGDFALTELYHGAFWTRQAWPVPAPRPGPVDRIRAELEVALGQQLDDQGAVKVLDAQEWHQAAALARNAPGSSAW